MISKETASIPEDIGWVPAIEIRLHHLMQRMPGKFRILRLYSPISIFIGTVLAMAHTEENIYYALDTRGAYGTSEYEQKREERKEVSVSMNQALESLPDDAIVKVHMDKDSICNSCSIGKHCTATNYKEHGRNRNVHEFEGKKLRSLHRKLLKKGFYEDVDFKLVPTTQTFLDYHGENLWTSDETPTPLTVEYDALLVRMGALRRVV